MASRLDSMRNQFQLGGQTVSTSDEELRNLSSRSGRQAPPTQPLESAVLGAGPNQAKMAGSSANLGTAQKLSLKPQEQLPGYLSQLQAAGPLLAEEQGRIARARSMGNLNSLEERVQAAAMTALGTGLNVANLVLDDTKLPTTLVDAKNADNTPIPNQNYRTQAISLLNKVGSNQALTDTEWSTLINLLGYDAGTRTTDQIKDDIKNKYFKTAQQSLTEAATAGDARNLMMSSLQPNELGFDSWGDIAALLKLPPGTDISTMTVKQFTDEINRVTTEEYSRTSSLLRILKDPNVGAAEKEAARQALNRLGATGIMAAEVDVGGLADQIDDINTVTIGGKEYTISEILSDSTMTALIDDYLHDPAKKAQIDASSPPLAAWINSNKTRLEDAISKIDPGIASIKTITENNKKLSTPYGTDSFNDSVMSTLFGADWKKSTTALTPPPIYTVFSNSNYTDVHKDLLDLMNSLSGRPEDLKFLAGITGPGEAPLTGEQYISKLSSLGLLSKTNIAAYKTYVNTSTNIQALSESAAPESIIRTLFGTDNRNELNTVLQQVKALNDSNLIDDITSQNDMLLNILDADGDGQLDNSSDILTKAKSLFTGKSLKDMVNVANDVNTGSSLLEKLKTKVTSGLNDDLYTALTYPKNGQQVSILSDGKIGEDEIAAIEALHLSNDTLQELIDRKVPGSNLIKNLISKNVTAKVTTLITNVSSSLGQLIKGKQVPDEEVVIGLQALRKALDEDTLEDMSPAEREEVKTTLNSMADTRISEITTKKDKEKTTTTSAIRTQLDKITPEVEAALSEVTRLTSHLSRVANRTAGEWRPNPGYTREDVTSARTALTAAQQTYQQKKAQKAALENQISTKETEIENKYAGVLAAIKSYKMSVGSVGPGIAG